MATMTCPSCGSEVTVSEALYCPFCGQTLRRVFADGSSAAPGEASAPVPASVPVSPSESASPASSQSQPPAGWTPYPEQAAFRTAPTAEQPAAPASQIIRNQAVVVSALVVMALGALLVSRQFQIASFLMRLQGSAYYLRFGVESLVLYSALALVAAYWLGWLRLAYRRASHVTLEAIALCILILVTEEMLIRLALRLVGPSYYHDENPFLWWNYLRSEPGLFVWIVILSTAVGALGVRLASSCARWSLVKQIGRRATPVADFFTVSGACALLLIAAAVIISRTRIGSVSAADAVVIAAVIVATLLAVRSGKRRLEQA